MVASVLIVPALAVWLYTAVIWNRYFETLPRVPNPVTERIYPRNIHGIVVFQTHAEKVRLDMMSCVSLAVLTLGIVIGILEERHWKRTAGKNIPPMPKGWQPRKSH
jgi:hypothetical protein